MKRYCQTLELVDDPELIERYCDIHAHVWPEVVAGLGKSASSTCNSIVMKLMSL